MTFKFLKVIIKLTTKKRVDLQNLTLFLSNKIFLYDMTIITFQNQDCKVYKQVPMTKDMLVKDLFNNITKSTLRGQSYNNILDTLKRGLRYNDCKTKYSQNKVVVKDACPNNSYGSYNRAMSHLKKLGMTLSHEGHIYLNPLVETRTTSKLYELVLNYYNLLWSDEFKATVNITYKDSDYSLPTVESLKEIVAEDYKLLLQNDSDLQCLSTKDLNNIAFIFKKAELQDQFPSLDYKDLVALKSKISKTYTNLGYSTMKEIAATHADILFEQLPIQRLDNNEVEFARLPKKWKCIHFSETSIYKEGEQHYLLQDQIGTDEYFGKYPIEDTKQQDPIQDELVSAIPEQLIQHCNQEDIQQETMISTPLKPTTYNTYDELSEAYKEIEEEVKQELKQQDWWCIELYGGTHSKPLTKRPYTPEELERINQPSRTPEEDYEYFSRMA